MVVKCKNCKSRDLEAIERVVLAYEVRPNGSLSEGSIREISPYTLACQRCGAEQPAKNLQKV